MILESRIGKLNEPGDRIVVGGNSKVSIAFVAKLFGNLEPMNFSVEFELLNEFSMFLLELADHRDHFA